jgi:hypothetical protein
MIVENVKMCCNVFFYVCVMNHRKTASSLETQMKLTPSSVANLPTLHILQQPIQKPLNKAGVGFIQTNGEAVPDVNDRKY